MQLAENTGSRPSLIEFFREKIQRVVRFRTPRSPNFLVPPVTAGPAIIRAGLSCEPRNLHLFGRRSLGCPSAVHRLGNLWRVLHPQPSLAGGNSHRHNSLGNYRRNHFRPLPAHSSRELVRSPRGSRALSRPVLASLLGRHRLSQRPAGIAGFRGCAHLRVQSWNLRLATPQTPFSWLKVLLALAQRALLCA